MNRRNFLKYTTMAGTMLPLSGNWAVRALAATPFTQMLGQLSTDTDHVLVMIQLGGGNDGLNTFIPLDQYDRLQAARPQVILPQSSLLPLSGISTAALHPAMTGMQQLYNEGKMCVVQSVGYPNPDFSHFRSTDIWLTGSDSDQYLNTGWLGRYLANEYPNYPTGYPNAAMPDPLAVEIGYNQSLSFQGAATGMGFSIADPEYFYEIIQGIQPPVPATPAGEQLDYVRMIARQSQVYNEVISNAYNAAAAQGVYPNTELAAKLKIVARLIAGGLRSRFYLIHHNGFDTHSEQVEADNHTIGNHANLLAQLSNGIQAFQNDLQGLGIADRVLTMTFSEFGRRIIGNDSNGTDHGTAAPMFVVGNSVAGGVLGSNPTIPINATEDDNLPMQYDFRSVYSTLLAHWFCVPHTDLDLAMLQNYPILPIVGVSDCVTGLHQNPPHTASNPARYLKVAPNPCTQHAQISIDTAGGYTTVQLFNRSGQLIDTLFQGQLLAGQHTFVWQCGHLPSGLYYCRLQNGLLQAVQTLVKM